MAHLGHNVAVYDIDPSRIAMLASGVPPFYEPGFAELLKSTLGTGRLRFTDSVKEAVSAAEIHFICVGTPQRQGADAADLSGVDSAFQAILNHADRPGTIVGKSTVPVGTAQRLAEAVSSTDAGNHLEVAWNPEFLREGTAIQDTLKPDRLVFGVASEAGERALIEAYSVLLGEGIPSNHH